MSGISEADLFATSYRLAQKTAKEAGGSIAAEAESMRKLRILRNKKIQKYARKEALTGKLSKKDKADRQSLVNEKEAEKIKEALEFRLRDDAHRINNPSEKKDSLTPAERKLLRLKTGKKDLDIA